MTLDDSVRALRLRVMARAQALGNVSQACREAGISRTLFYRWRKRYVAYGPDGLHDSGSTVGGLGLHARRRSRRRRRSRAGKARWTWSLNARAASLSTPSRR